MSFLDISWQGVKDISVHLPWLVVYLSCKSSKKFLSANQPLRWCSWMSLCPWTFTPLVCYIRIHIDSYGISTSSYESVAFEPVFRLHGSKYLIEKYSKLIANHGILGCYLQTVSVDFCRARHTHVPLVGTWPWHKCLAIGDNRHVYTWNSGICHQFSNANEPQMVDWRIGENSNSRRCTS